MPSPRRADLLHCAVGTAHSSGEAMDVQQRAVMHLVQMAKGVVDRALEVRAVSMNDR